jgi:hypothetical protein
MQHHLYALTRPRSDPKLRKNPTFPQPAVMVTLGSVDMQVVQLEGGLASIVIEQMLTRPCPGTVQS